MDTVQHQLVVRAGPQQRRGQVVSIQPGRRAVVPVALKSGETMSVSLKCLHEMPPALDPDEPGPESEPLASGDPGMERHCEASRADMHMAVDSDSQLANLEQGEPEQELDSQMTDAPSSPEPAHSPINPSERSSPGPHSSVDPADYSSDSD